MDTKASRRCTFLTRPGIVEGSEGEGEVGGTNRENSLQVGKGSELGLVVGFKICRVL